MDDSNQGTDPFDLAWHTSGNILALYQQDGPTVKSRPLANTGWTVSEIALGTVELGMEYGFRCSAHYSPPFFDDAVALLRRAFDLGITLFDTAPTYGSGEALLPRLRRRIGPASHCILRSSFRKATAQQK